MRFRFPLFLFVLFFVSCSVSKKIERSARENVLHTEALKAAHVGICVYEPATGKYWFNYQGDKYFVPASNTKIPTCYAAMKYLGDSLVGLKYQVMPGGTQKNVLVRPTGDPTFLHPDFPQQPVYNFLQRDTSVRFMYLDDNWKEEALGSGWSWNDFAEYYMAERSAFPIHGNVVHFRGTSDGLSITPRSVAVAYGGAGDEVENLDFRSGEYTFTRKKDANVFLWDHSKRVLGAVEIPFLTSTKQSLGFLKDTLRGLHILRYSGLSLPQLQVIHSQPTDSLLRPMMHRSDNFFAEQSLLMVSNEVLGYMSDEKIIDTLLKTDFKNLPQKPRWADGSGLSRYNLFTPQDFVFILNKMRSEFGMARIKTIFATGGEGTLGNYYKKESGFLYAKTGTLSGVVALSGFLQTQKGKELIFSVQVNNHTGSATDVRRAVEKFIEGIREDF